MVVYTLRTADGLAAIIVTEVLTGESAMAII